MNLWRISRHRSLNGEGGRLFAGRWNNPGAPVVYLADSPGGAMVEVLVHLQVEDELMPPSYTLLQVVVPDELEVPLLDLPAGEGWKTNLKLTRRLGDAWLRARETALVKVPSAILPATFNYLLNPLHVDADRIAIGESWRGFYDARLLRRQVHQ